MLPLPSLLICETFVPTPLTHSSHRAFSHAYTCFSTEKLSPQYLHGLLLSDRRVTFCHHISSFLSLLRHHLFGYCIVTHYDTVTARWSLASDSPSHWCNGVHFFTPCPACRLVFPVHADTTNAVCFAALQNVALLHVARETQRVQRVAAFLSRPIAPWTPAFAARLAISSTSLSIPPLLLPSFLEKKENGRRTGKNWGEQGGKCERRLEKLGKG